MIKHIEQKEINEISEILSSCGIIPLHFVRSFLYKRGKTEQQTEAIINQMVKRKLAYFDSSNLFLRINKGIEVSEINKGCVKSLYLFLDLAGDIHTYFVLAENPHVMTFQKKDDKCENPFYDVFYIQCSSEKLDSYIIKNKFSNGEINAFIIVDDESQIDRISLPDNISVTAFVKVDVDGNVAYIERG